ncbi:MAG: 30S ribosomal protein S14 [Fimbriimonadaceae bacterium]|nr:30S ribosomal protein S14 [Fimbriimonadaceae bacterium]
MAKKCLIEKQAKLQATWERLRKEEQEIKALPLEQRQEAMEAFKTRRVRNRQFKARFYNRSAIGGRARGYIRFFGISRQVFREMAHRGQIPGVTKSSW